MATNDIDPADIDLSIDTLKKMLPHIMILEDDWCCLTDDDVTFSNNFVKAWYDCCRNQVRSGDFLRAKVGERQSERDNMEKQYQPAKVQDPPPVPEQIESSSVPPKELSEEPKSPRSVKSTKSHASSSQKRVRFANLDASTNNEPGRVLSLQKYHHYQNLVLLE